jgi:glutathione peroxidase-family protein/uncharacterized protein (UPF0548 family)
MPVPGGSWEAARSVMRGYEFADPAIVRAYYDPGTPLERRDMLLQLRALGLLHVYVGVRVGAVYDEQREWTGRQARVWGWNYRTLAGHVEMGQMDWEVWKWLDSGEVEFRIHAVSRPAPIANPFVALGFRVLHGYERNRFLRSTQRRMRRFTELGLARATGATAWASCQAESMSLVSTIRMYLQRPPNKVAEPTDLYEHRVALLDGGELDLASLRGHPTLIVNTASKCGYTPQYEGLQSLYERYEGRGLRVLGSPSADFADQEFDDAEEIGAFCQKNYGVSFPLTERMSVRAQPSPLWRDLARQPGSGPPVWNFSKYLVGADGRLIARWPTKVTPEDPQIVAAIEQALPS